MKARVVTVCRIDGVVLGETRTGRLVHLGELPQETPEHDPIPAGLEAHVRDLDRDEALLSTATDMLVHHASLHPETGCPWAANLERALKAE